MATTGHKLRGVFGCTPGLAWALLAIPAVETGSAVGLRSWVGAAVGASTAVALRLVIEAAHFGYQPVAPFGDCLDVARRMRVVPHLAAEH